MGGLSPHRRRGIGAIQDPEVRKQIAKLGGLATKQRHEHDRGYYSRNGKKGGAIVYNKYGDSFYSHNGKKSALVKELNTKENKKTNEQQSQT